MSNPFHADEMLQLTENSAIKVFMQRAPVKCETKPNQTKPIETKPNEIETKRNRI